MASSCQFCITYQGFWNLFCQKPIQFKRQIKDRGVVVTSSHGQGLGLATDGSCVYLIARPRALPWQTHATVGGKRMRPPRGASTGRLPRRLPGFYRTGERSASAKVNSGVRHGRYAQGRPRPRHPAWTSGRSQRTPNVHIDNLGLDINDPWVWIPQTSMTYKIYNHL